MKFLKNLFEDESTIIGLCGFKAMRPKYGQKPIMKEDFFNPFEFKKPLGSNFETNLKENILLKV